jgi:hypothetical protein
MGASVLTDTPGDALRDIDRHPARLLAPRLIRHFIQVAVVTGQVASAVDLDDEFAERKGTPATRYERGDIEA